MKRSEAIKTRSMIEKAVNSLDDTEAVEIKTLFPAWEKLIGTTAPVGFKFRYGNKLKKVIQEHIFSAEWNPDTAISLYTDIDEQHAGTREDPIPFNGNMELNADLYYSQFGEVYFCDRPTGQPVFNNLADLVGVYVSEVTT